MEEKNIKETALDIAKDINRNFDEDNALPRWSNYSAVSKFKSVRRAIRRGHVSLDGYIYPKRPFNNAKHKDNSLNDRKKMIYDKLREKQKRGR